MWRGVAWALSGILAIGCGRLGFERQAGKDASSPAACDDGRQNGFETDVDCGGDCGPCEAGDLCTEPADCLSGRCMGDTCAAASCDDGVQNQGEPFPDSGGPCTIRAPDCSEGVDPWTTSLYSFDDLPSTQLTDAAADRDGLFAGAQPPAAAGRSGCETSFEPAGETAGTVASDTAWRMTEGSVDFWLFTPSQYDGIRFAISRDSSELGEGHLGLGINANRRLVLRAQTAAEEIYRCSEPLPENAWVHVGVNFGAPDLELYVGGVPQAYVGTEPFFLNNDVECSDASFLADLSGNDNAWAFGAGNYRSSEGGNDALEAHLSFGALIDHIRISSARRDFTRR